MSNIAKLKKQAAEFEQKRQFDKALAKYRQVLDEIDGDLDEADVALYNRVGDLLLRQGNVTDAVIHYERAVDLYADGGFFSNAIALCNKILRTAPGRSNVYYKLGSISARKGFISDAKQNFLEYADRMRKQGQLDEAFRALKEFADLCPDQEDIRIMLADQLARDGRKDEAIEQLQRVYEKLSAEGRTIEASAALDRMRALDPSVVPSTNTPTSSPSAEGRLEFLTHDEPTPPRPRTPVPTPRAVPRYTPHGALTPVDLGGLPLIHSGDDEPETEPVEGLEVSPSATDAEVLTATPVDGLETSYYEAGDEVPPISRLDDLEATALDGSDVEDALDADENDEDDEDDTGSDFDLPFLHSDEPLGEQEEYTESATGEQDAVPESVLIAPEVIPQEPEEITLVSRESPFPLETYEGGQALGLPDDSVPLLGADEAGGEDEEEPAGEREVSRAVEVDETAREEELPVRIAAIRRKLEDNRGDPELHRALGEALLEYGAREEGMEQLEAAIWELERIGSFGKAYSLANEILRVDPDAVRFHQKRVEFAFRTGEKQRLVEAYLGLADSLVRSGELAKARVVYRRVIDLAPDDPRAPVALDTIAEPELPDSSAAAAPPPAAEPPRPVTPPRAAPPPAAGPKFAPPPAAAPKFAPPPRQAAPARPAASTAPAGATHGAVRPASKPTPVADDFIDLASWMQEEEERPRSTRMILEGVTEPEDDAQVDFAEMLERFKEGVAANVDEGDFQSHYDLGIAYREMGLLDEAIAEFQKALRSADDRVKTYEALGQCFIEKGHYPVAVTLLTRALSDGGHGDDTLIGVLYMLGSACQALGQQQDARTYYERVYAVDIRFRDVHDRLAAVTQDAQ